jgi:hypothetical protein
MERFATLAREFPDFDLSTLPTIPDDWQDTSWHNDACPSFLNEAAGLILFVDFADIKLREFADGPRFNVNRWEDGNTGQILVESDDWQTVLDRVPLLQVSP